MRSNYENKQGKSPLMIRIFLNGEMLNVGSSGICIDKKLWDSSTSRMKGRSSEALNLNAQLDNISSSLQTIFKKHEFDEDLTLDKIKSIFLGKNKVKTTFVEFYDKYLEDIKAQVGAGKSIALYHKYSAARKHFVNFLHTKYGRKDLMPGELTHLIIHDFEIYLRTVVALKPNSATKIPQMIITKHEGKTKDGRLLPVLSNQKINAYLKEIADLCGIKKRLSYHLARHTFATMSLSKGVPIESVSKMLGHTNIKTTQIYARITNKKIEQDMMQAADKFNGFKEYFKS